MKSALKKCLAIALAGLAVTSFVPAAKAELSEELVIAAVGFAAKESCSCRYVVEQSETYCREFGTPPGGLFTPSFQFDDSAKTVTVAGPLGVRRVARFGAKNGCLLDKP
jgi:hypothetical protein